MIVSLHRGNPFFAGVSVMRLVEGEVMQSDFCDSEHGADQVVRTQEIHIVSSESLSPGSEAGGDISHKTTALSLSR